MDTNNAAFCDYVDQVINEFSPGTPLFSDVDRLAELKQLLLSGAGIETLKSFFRGTWSDNFLNYYGDAHLRSKEVIPAIIRRIDQRLAKKKKIEAATFLLRGEIRDAELNGMMRESVALDYIESLNKVERELLVYSLKGYNKVNSMKES